MIEKPVSKLIPDIPRVMKLPHLRNIITRRNDIEIFRENFYYYKYLLSKDLFT